VPSAAGERIPARLMAEQTRQERARAREQGTLEFMRGPIGARTMDRVGRRQYLVAGFVTNVPGPEGICGGGRLPTCQGRCFPSADV
jgi:diacylglycerol O-acyltransferase / wax synthase